MAFVLFNTLTWQSSHSSGQGAESVNPDKYVPVMLDLYPPGPLWSRELDTNLASFNRAIGTELSRSEHRGEQLLRELDPRTAIEMLPEWEAMLDLPDTTSAATDLASRQQAAWEKYASVGGIDPDFLIEVAARLGYTIEVEHEYIADGALPCSDAPAGDPDEGARAGQARANGTASKYRVIVHTKAGGNDAQLVSALNRFFHQSSILTVLYDLP